MVLSLLGVIMNDSIDRDIILDAMRYRWLKSRPDVVPVVGPDLANWEDHSGKAIRGDEADMIIDEYMKKETETMSEYDLVAHLHRQKDFSLKTYGPGKRYTGIFDHINKELKEIEEDEENGLHSLSEWIDVILLALDGAWRSGASPEDIAAALEAKQSKNESRSWPDWRKVDPNKAIEHDRSKD